MERVSAQMQLEPWNQMTSWWKGSKASETLLTDRQLSFLSWVWEFQWDICVTKQVQPSSHHGKAVMRLETQIAGCLLAARETSTLTILQAFFLPLVKTDLFGRDLSSTHSYSLLFFKLSFLITFTLLLKAQILAGLYICWLLIDSPLAVHDISHCVLHLPAAIIRDQSWKEQLRSFWKTPSHFSGS